MKNIRCPINRIALSARRQRPALAGATPCVSYARLDAAVTGYSELLKRAGIKKGNHVALWGESSTGFIIAYFAALRLGCRPCLINIRQPGRSIRDSLTQMQCRAVLVPARHRRRYPGLSVTSYVEEAYAEAGKVRAQTHSYAAEAVADLMPTSGSSGQPKIVVHSVANHYYSARGSNTNIPLTDHDGWLLSLPVYHVSGLSILWRCFLAGACVVIPDRDHPQGGMLPPEVTHISCVPVQLADLLTDRRTKTRLKRLKAVLLGGSSVPSRLVARACRAHVPLYASYGLTEMTSQVATTARLKDETGLGRARVLPHRRVRVDKRQEIWVAGPVLCRGFWLDGRIKPAADRQGWYRTGDIGSLSGKSLLRITGRADRMFISGGENIHPEEIEKALMNLEGVEQAVVFPRRCPRFGARPVAVILTGKGRSVSAAVLRRRLVPVVEKFKIPVEFYQWPAARQSGPLKTDRIKLVQVIKREGKPLR